MSLTFPGGADKGCRAIPAAEKVRQAIRDGMAAGKSKQQILVDVGPLNRELGEPIDVFSELYAEDIAANTNSDTMSTPRRACPNGEKSPSPQGSSRSSSPQGEPSRNGIHQEETPRREEPTPWPDPIPLGEPPPVLPFPIETLPVAARRMAEETAWAMNVPIDLVAPPMLALAGGAIANARHLAITRTHTQSPCLFAAVVGPPGTARTPVLKLLRQPIDQAQETRLEEWQKAKSAWEAAEEAEGQKPVLRRCIVSDITTESLGIILCDNPRGVVCIRDELSGLVAGLNQYKQGKGHDRQVYLSLWSGDTVLIDRKSDKSREGAPIYVRNPFTAIIGSIQPDVLPRLRGEAVRGVPPPDDGFLDRFLIVYPAVLPAIGEQWREVSPEALEGWTNAISRLLALRMVEQDGEPARPFLVHLTASGKIEWKQFTDAHAAEINAPDFPPCLFGPWAKLRGYGARLALILHFLRWAYGETNEEDVDGKDMAAAARLVDYFKSHSRKVHNLMDADPRVAAARRAVRWIVEGRRATFTKRDAFEGLKGTFKTVEALDAALGVVEKHGLIRLKETPDSLGRGRKPSPIYETHPSLLRTYSHNSQNSQNCPPNPNSANSANDSSEEDGFGQDVIDPFDEPEDESC
jgi:hypothetical protein